MVTRGERRATDIEGELALGRLLADWEAAEGPVDEGAVAAVAQRYGIGPSLPQT